MLLEGGERNSPHVTCTTSCRATPEVAAEGGLVEIARRACDRGRSLSAVPVSSRAAGSAAGGIARRTDRRGARTSSPFRARIPRRRFCENGFAVLAPNFRGSANYGAEFRLKNIESQGFGDFDDVMTGVDLSSSRASPIRTGSGVMGWSYGGFLTAWVIGHTDRLQGGIGRRAGHGLDYLLRAVGRTAQHSADVLRRTPWDKPESYNRHSPRTGVANIHTPRCCRSARSISITTTRSTGR